MRVNRIAQGACAFRPCVSRFALLPIIGHALLLIGGHTLLLIGHHASHFPIAAVAALLEAGYHMPQMRRLAAARHDIAMRHQQEMQVLGHDDEILNLQHRVEAAD